MRPSTAINRNGPVIPEHAISAFDQFNRDILDNKVANESVKRLKPKSSFMKSQMRVQSARRKANAAAPLPRMGKRVQSAKSLKTANANKAVLSKFGQTKDGILNLKIKI